jgi:hypothetical protein
MNFYEQIVKEADDRKGFLSGNKGNTSVNTNFISNIVPSQLSVSGRKYNAGGGTTKEVSGAFIIDFSDGSTMYGTTGLPGTPYSPGNFVISGGSFPAEEYVRAAQLDDMLRDDPDQARKLVSTGALPQAPTVSVPQPITEDEIQDWAKNINISAYGQNVEGQKAGEASGVKYPEEYVVYDSKGKEIGNFDNEEQAQELASSTPGSEIKKEKVRYRGQKVSDNEISDAVMGLLTKGLKTKEEIVAGLKEIERDSKSGKVSQFGSIPDNRLEKIINNVMAKVAGAKTEKEDKVKPSYEDKASFGVSGDDTSTKAFETEEEVRDYLTQNAQQANEKILKANKDIGYDAIDEIDENEEDLFMLALMIISSGHKIDPFLLQNVLDSYQYEALKKRVDEVDSLNPKDIDLSEIKDYLTPEQRKALQKAIAEAEDAGKSEIDTALLQDAFSDEQIDSLKALIDSVKEDVPEDVEEEIDEDDLFGGFDFDSFDDEKEVAFTADEEEAAQSIEEESEDKEDTTEDQEEEIPDYVGSDLRPFYKTEFKASNPEDVLKDAEIRKDLTSEVKFVVKDDETGEEVGSYSSKEEADKNVPSEKFVVYDKDDNKVAELGSRREMEKYARENPGSKVETITPDTTYSVVRSGLTPARTEEIKDHIAERMMELTQMHINKDTIKDLNMSQEDSELPERYLSSFFHFKTNEDGVVQESDGLPKEEFEELLTDYHRWLPKYFYKLAEEHGDLKGEYDSSSKDVQYEIDGISQKFTPNRSEMKSLASAGVDLNNIGSDFLSDANVAKIRSAMSARKADGLIADIENLIDQPEFEPDPSLSGDDFSSLSDTPVEFGDEGTVGEDEATVSGPSFYQPDSIDFDIEEDKQMVPLINSKGKKMKTDPYLVGPAALSQVLWDEIDEIPQEWVEDEEMYDASREAFMKYTLPAVRAAKHFEMGESDDEAVEQAARDEVENMFNNMTSVSIDDLKGVRGGFYESKARKKALKILKERSKVLHANKLLVESYNFRSNLLKLIAG